MKSFKTFFKTTIGMRPQSEGVGTEKKADAAAVAAGMKSAFGGSSSPAPAADPAPAPSSDTGSLGGNIAAGLKSMVGG